MKRIRQINEVKRTTGTMNSSMRDAFVPNWDKRPGAAQQLDRILPRERMGNKMTPRGNARLRRS